MSMFRERISRQLRKPTSGLWGMLVRRLMRVNEPVQEKTFQMLEVSPEHDVLEVGFGYGHGLEYALEHGMRDGSGTLYGLDYSAKACKASGKLLSKDVKSGKLVLFNEDIRNMSLPDASADRIWHTNCYYFWPDLEACCKELFRVMKPRGMMVTGLVMENLERATQNDLLRAEWWNPNKYMEALEKANFYDVHMREVSGETETKMQVIFAKKWD